MKNGNLIGFRIIYVVVILVLLLSMVSLAACSGSPSTTTMTTSVVTTATTTQTTSVVATSTVTSVAFSARFRMAPGGDTPPPSAGYTIAVTDMADLIKTRTNGRVIIEPYWSQTLVSQNNIVSALQSGTADLAQMVPHVETGKVPLCMVGQLPGIGTDLWARISAFYELYNQDPGKAELGKYNIKCVSAMGATDSFVLSKAPIRTLAEMKGKKVAASGISAQSISAFGGVPVTMGPQDQYTGIDKGTIDCIACPLAAVYSFKLYEVAKYYTYLPNGPRVIPVGMNQDSWNKMPSDIQKIFTDSVPDFIISATNAMVKVTDPAALESMKAANVEFIKFSDADMVEANKLLSSIADQWAAGQGDNGKKILSDFKALVDKYEKISPYKK
jgi:TRAP-type transport system periplasmic protein